MLDLTFGLSAEAHAVAPAVERAALRLVERLTLRLARMVSISSRLELQRYAPQYTRFTGKMVEDALREVIDATAKWYRILDKSTKAVTVNGSVEDIEIAKREGKIAVFLGTSKC
jgi:microsomal dipeptidase-like Zn-dependent dipeptidase